MKVHAAVAYDGRASLALEDLELSGPGPDDILVRIVGSGLCHTDVKGRDGQLPVPKPVVLGHEGAGVVESVGERVTKVRPGDHVVLTYDSCGACAPCKRGDLAYCDQSASLNFTDARSHETGRLTNKAGTAIHGHFFGQSSFANYAIARERNTVPVRKDVPIEFLGVLGCSVQTGAGAVMNSLQARAGGTMAIFGAGPVGLSAILGAVLCGCAVIVAVDVLPSRLKIARQLGATHTVLSAPLLKTSEEIHKMIPGGVDCVFDTTARGESYHQAILSLARKGRFGFVAAPMGRPELNINMSIVMNRGLTIRGIVQGDSVPDAFIPKLIDLHLAGRFPFDKFLTKYPFERINEAIEDQVSGKVVKPVFTFAP